MTEHHQSPQALAMVLGVCTILASVVASSRGGDLPCPAGGRECPQELLPLHHCNASLQEDGRVRALCKILIKATPQQVFHTVGPRGDDDGRTSRL
ncbi:hypothetical protein MTO96_021523 [Rhipicephalus appendiculatus]